MEEAFLLPKAPQRSYAHISCISQFDDPCFADVAPILLSYGLAPLQAYQSLPTYEPSLWRYQAALSGTVCFKDNR